MNFDDLPEEDKQFIKEFFKRAREQDMEAGGDGNGGCFVCMANDPEVKECKDE